MNKVNFLVNISNVVNFFGLFLQQQFKGSLHKFGGFDLW